MAPGTVVVVASEVVVGVVAGSVVAGSVVGGAALGLANPAGTAVVVGDVEVEAAADVDGAPEPTDAPAVVVGPESGTDDGTDEPVVVLASAGEHRP